MEQKCTIRTFHEAAALFFYFYFTKKMYEKCIHGRYF